MELHGSRREGSLKIRSKGVLHVMKINESVKRVERHTGLKRVGEILEHV